MRRWQQRLGAAARASSVVAFPESLYSYGHVTGRRPSELGRLRGRGAFRRAPRVAEVGVSTRIKLTEAEAGTLRSIDAMRDDEQHWYTIVDEGLLYLHARAAVTLFDDLLHRAFDDRLADYLPLRVLPIGSEPPQDFQTLVDREYDNRDAGKIDEPPAADFDETALVAPRGQSSQRLGDQGRAVSPSLARPSGRLGPEQADAAWQPISVGGSH